MRRPYLTYLALGDSLTVGVGASFLAPGFVGRYKQITEEKLDKHVFTTIYAKSGIETGEVLKIARINGYMKKLGEQILSRFLLEEMI